MHRTRSFVAACRRLFVLACILILTGMGFHAGLDVRDSAEHLADAAASRGYQIDVAGHAHTDCESTQKASGGAAASHHHSADSHSAALAAVPDDVRLFAAGVEGLGPHIDLTPPGLTPVGLDHPPKSPLRRFA